MEDEAILNGFMEGFAKAAEDAGLRGGQVKALLELSVDLAQREAHPEAFDAGFASVIGGE